MLRWWRRKRGAAVWPHVQSGLHETFRMRPRSNSTEMLMLESHSALDPSSRFVQAWNQIVLLCIIYEMVTLPYLAVFNTDSTVLGSRGQLIGVYICELVFCGDVYVQLHTGFYEDGNVLRDTRRSRQKYIQSGAFALDLLALPPYSLLPIDSLPFSRVFLEYHKFLRIWRVPKLVSELDDVYERYFAVLKLTKVLVTTLFLSHIVACARFGYGYDTEHTNPWLPEEPSHSDMSRRHEYLRALFWAFGLLTGLFEGELPQTSSEFTFAIIVAFCGFALFTYLCATLFLLSKCHGGHAETSEARVNQFKHVLAFHRVPEHFQRPAVEYLKRYYTQSEANDRDAAKLLCPSITADIQFELLADTVASIPVFQDCDRQFLKAVTSLLELVSYPAQFELFRTGDHGDAMYIVHSGVLHTMINGANVRELRKGNFFGEVAVFARLPRSATVVTTTYCTLYRLTRFHAEKLLEGYEEYARHISVTVQHILQRHPTEQVDKGIPLEASSDIRSPQDAPAVSPPSPSAGKRALHRSRTDRPKRPKAPPPPNAPEDRVKSSTQLKVDSIANAQQASAAQMSPSSSVIKIPDGGPTLDDVHHGSRGALHSSIIMLRKPTRVQPSGDGLFAGDLGDSIIKPRRISDDEALLRKSRSQTELFRTTLKRFGRSSATSESKRSDVMKGFYDQLQRLAVPRSNSTRWWRRLLMSQCLDADGRGRMVWVILLQLNLWYNWVVVPLAFAFPLLSIGEWQPGYWIPNVFMDVMLWVDIYVNLNLSFSVNAETIWDPTRSAARYVKSLAFVSDLICALPYQVVQSLAWHVMTNNALARLPRLLRVWRLPGHISEIEQRIVFNSRRRLMLLGLILLFLFHAVACLHFSITSLDGFSHHEVAWLPSADLKLVPVNATYVKDEHGAIFKTNSNHVSSIIAMQYFRSLYYAANVLVALGRTVEPSSELQYGFALIFMLNGFLITATIVDNVQKRFTASAFEQKEFFATRAQIQRFLKRQNAPVSIHQRVNSFLDYWWSAHRGAIIGELLNELPEVIKRDIVRCISRPAVDMLEHLTKPLNDEPHADQDSAASTVSAAASISAAVEQVQLLFIDSLRFVLYGQGERIYYQGDYPAGLFFLLEGHIALETDGVMPRRIPLGGFFGTAVLDVLAAPDEESAATIGYTENATALSGCIVVVISKEHLGAMQNLIPSLSPSLRLVERRLMDARVSRASEVDDLLRSVAKCASVHGRHATNTDLSWFSRTQRSIVRSTLWRFVSGRECIDPDSTSVRAWEIFAFVAMTLECCLVILYTCFGSLSNGSTTFAIEDVGTILLEACLLVDMVIHLRLGYYEYGNKVMNPKRVQYHYSRSSEFFVDIVAILPLFMLNWFGVPRHQRLEALNLNKLVRIFKVPSLFQAFEAKHVKRTMELRLLRLVYYTFLASHMLGCMWFEFAAHSSGLFDSNATSFGENEWMPPAELAHAPRALQYFSSLFWSFGVMSASFTGDLPKSVSQSLFSVVTMTVGFFLFAYVVGNFLDIIELQDAESRHFIARLGALRRMLSHFRLPVVTDSKFKTYFFFKRFHSITQEHVLERVLPPSLLIDIRMFQLQPMIVKVAFLVGMEDAAMRMLVSLFTQLLVVKDDFICYFGEEGKEMFFIFTGVLDIFVPLPANSKRNVIVGAETTAINASAMRMAISDPAAMMAHFHKVNEISAGHYFGEAALFTRSPRNAHVKAHTSCILYRLSRHSLELVFERFPDWKKKVLRIVKLQQEQQRLMRLTAETQVTESRYRSLHSVDPALVLQPRAPVWGRVILESVWFMAIKRVVQALVRSTQRSYRFVRQVCTRCISGIELQSRIYRIWLRIVAACTMYTAVLVPYRCAYDSLERDSALPIVARVLMSICDLVFCADIWFHLHVQESRSAMELYEVEHLAEYKRGRLIFDAIAAFPLDHFLIDLVSPLDRIGMRQWLRLNRCVKVLNLEYYLREIHRRSVTYEKDRLRTLMMIYLLVIFWTSCAYFAVSMKHGFGEEWQSWLPSEVLHDTEDPNVLLLRLFRGLFFGTTAFVKRGRTFRPPSTLDLVFTIWACFLGQLVLAVMIGEIASLFILSIDNEVEFRKNRIAVDRYLSRHKISTSLRHRVNTFFTSWWSSHAGVDYQMLLEDMPTTVRIEGLLFITHKPMLRFVDHVFRPLTQGLGDDRMGHASVEQLLRSLAQRLVFEGYPRGEKVLVEGTIGRAMYLVVRGFLITKCSYTGSTTTTPSSRFPDRFRTGDYFGEIGLLGHSVSLYTVTTIRACDLFVLRAQDLSEILKAHAFFAPTLHMAQGMVSQHQSVHEFFANSINQARRKALSLRLVASTNAAESSPQSSSPPSSPRAARGTTNTSSPRDAAATNATSAIAIAWQDAFRRFAELIAPQYRQPTDAV